MTPEPQSQAARIFARFGGATALWKALRALGDEENKRRHISCVYRWNLPKATGGTGGIIPTRNMESVLAAARAEGIVLTADDMDPRVK